MENSKVTKAGALSQESHAAMIRKERRSNDALHKFLRNKTAVFGFIVIFIMTVFAVCSPLIATHDPNALSLANAYLPPVTCLARTSWEGICSAVLSTAPGSPWQWPGAVH